MQYTQLGNTNLNVSRLCFGCWQLSPSFWGDIDIKPWEEAIRIALESGINFLDTADAYGNGYAKEQLGSLMQEENLRDQFIVATKFYWNFTNPDARFADNTYDYIISACEASLKCLRSVPQMPANRSNRPVSDPRLGPDHATRRGRARVRQAKGAR